MLSDREEPTSLDGELRDLLENSMQENPIDEESLRESDKRVFEGITETGANTLQDIADEIKGDLESVQDASQQLASEIIEQETETLLSKYDEERATLLERMNDDKQAIEEELEKIKNLAQLVETPNEADHGVSKTSKVLLIVTALLGLGALYSGFIGLAFSDSESLANGAIDAVVAAISGFLLSRERSKI